MAASQDHTPRTTDNPLDPIGRVARVGDPAITIKPSVYAARFIQGSHQNFVYHAQGWADFSKKHDEKKADTSVNWSLTSITASLDDKDITVYAGVWTHSLYRNNKVARFQSWEEFLKEHQNNKATMRLIDFDVHPERGTRYITGTWGESLNLQELVYDIDWAAFTEKRTNMIASGWKLTKLKFYHARAYQTWHVAALFEKGGDLLDTSPTGRSDLIFATNWKDFQDKHAKIEGEGTERGSLRLRDFQVYDYYLTETRYYVGVYVETPYKSTAIFGNDWDSLNGLIAERLSNSSEVYGITRYAAEMQKINPKFKKVFDREFQHSYGYSGWKWLGGQVTSSHQNGVARGPQDPPETAFTANTRMHIASVSKAIAGVALLKLFHDKKKETGDSKYSIDTPFIKFFRPTTFPKLGKNVDKITIRNLLQHKTGMRKENEVAFRSIWTFLAKFLEYDAIGADIGVTMLYTNTNFTIVQAVIDSVTGHEGEQPDNYEAYVANKIFRPLGINTGIFTSEPGKVALQTLNYGDRLDKNDTRNGGSLGRMSGVAAGGWVTSSNELSKFLMGLLGGRILDPETLSFMFANQLGWQIAEGVFGQYVFKTGGMGHGRKKDDPLPEQGLTTSMVVFPTRGGAVTLVNQQGRDTVGATIWALEDRSDS